MQPRFVITGCSRSATRYSATLLTAAGLPCGHEDVFGPWTGALHLSDPFVMRPDLRGDSSFMAVPYLDRLHEGDWVFHQVRDPIAVVRSLVGIHFFAEEFVPSKDLAGSHLHYLAIVRDFLPVIFEPPDELARSVLYWLTWNEAVETSAARFGLNYLRYRVEDLDLDLVQRLAVALGSTLDREAAVVGLAEVSRKDNARTRDETISWGALAELPEDLRSSFTTLCERYGYPLPGSA